MPDSQHPPFVSGATSIPRQLNRWLDVNPQGGKLQRIQTFLQLPTFNVACTWNGYSTIVAAFNFECSNNFSLKPFVAPVNPNYSLVIMYRVGGIVTRYILWESSGSAIGTQVIPYVSQLILKNCRFEIWSTSQGNASESTGNTFYTSVRGNLDYRYGLDTALADNDGLVTAFGCNSLYTIPLTVTVASGGTTAANGTYSSLLNPAVSGFLYSKSASQYGYYGISGGSTGWTLFNGPFTLYESNTGSGMTDPTLASSWTAVNGSNPAPTVTVPSPVVITSVFALPLVFPTNATSTTN